MIQAEDVTGLTPATLGESENVDVGQQVVAVGSPFGLDAHRHQRHRQRARPPGQRRCRRRAATRPSIPPSRPTRRSTPATPAAPLVDLDGHVVGINSSIGPPARRRRRAGSIGLGFAIPIDDVLEIVEQLAAGETPTHALLGIGVDDAITSSTDVQITDGALVGEIGDGSAAEDAGLENGDVITAVDDHESPAPTRSSPPIRSYRPGDEVSVTFQRDGDEQDTTVTLESDG